MNNTDKAFDYKEFIKEVFDEYSFIEEATLFELLKICKVQQLKKGDLLLAFGKTSKHIHILHKGIIVSYFLCKDGNEYHKNIFMERDFVGSTVSSLKNEPSNFVLETLENCTVLSFNYKEYKRLIEQFADLKSFYIAYLEKNWVIDKEKREIEIVMKESYERYKDFIIRYPNIEKRIPLHYIASHLGITPTQLSRIRKKLRENLANQHM